MKKMSILILVSLLAAHILPQEPLHLLKIQEPSNADQKKRLLQLPLNQLQKIFESFDLAKEEHRIELADVTGQPLSVLAKVIKGKVKWSHKTENDQILQVRFDRDYYPVVLKKIMEQPQRPGLRIQVIDVLKKLDIVATSRHFRETNIQKNENMQGWKDISCVEYPDLCVQLKYPVRVVPGETMDKEFRVVVENRGLSPAENVTFQIFLSSDDTIPEKPLPESESFVEDGCLKNGSGVIPLINAGETKEIALAAPITLPADITPQNYFLAAVIDPDNQVKELTEANNSFSGLLVIYVPAPDVLAVPVPGVTLTFDPNNFAMDIALGDMTLSDGREWRKCRLKAHIYHFKHLSWDDFFWEINTEDRRVWEIKGAAFCKKGGTAKPVQMEMDVDGGSTTTLPIKITLQLPEFELKFIPKSGEFAILTAGYSIAHLPYWATCRTASNIFYFRHAAWKDFFLKIDSFTKTICRVSSGEFCKPGGSEDVLDLVVKTGSE